MALIKCPQCGRMTSDKAVCCPQCGMPIDEIKGAQQNVSEKNDCKSVTQPNTPSRSSSQKGKMPTWAWVLIIIGILLLGGGILFLSFMGNGEKTDVAMQKKNTTEDSKVSMREQFEDYSKTVENVNKQQQVAERDYEKRRKEGEKRAKEEIIEALQGTWEWRGRIKITDFQYMNSYSKLVVKGDNITDYADGRVVDKGTIYEIDIDNGIIRYGRDTYLEFDKDFNGNLKLYGDRKRGIQFKKASNTSSQSLASTRDYTFMRDQDVYEYLSSHRFTSGDLTLYFGNGGTVMYSNGNRLSNTLVVSDFDSRHAVLTYTSPYSPGTKIFTIDNKAGTLTDRSGEVYYSR